MRRHAPLLLVLFLFVPPLARAQSVANYGVARTTGNAYNSIAATGNVIGHWRNGVNTDDNRAEDTIGFTFRYMGNAYTTFNVSTNGFIDFSTSTADGSGSGAYGHINDRLSSSTVPTLIALAPFYEQITTSANPGTLASLDASVRYLTTGIAPNRVLTVEWVHMDLISVPSADLNFQLKLHENGSFEFNYGTMNPGVGVFTYTCGINGLSMSAPPTALELLTQQTANSATFGNTAQNALSVIPSGGSRLTFTPVENVTPASPGSITFTSVGNSGLTVGWTDLSVTETYFTVEQSTDGISFTPAGMLLSTTILSTGGAKSLAVTGLLPATLYTFRVKAANEASAPSAGVTGTRTTKPAGTFSIATGNWSSPATWSGNAIPTGSDTVTILDGLTVTVDNSTSCQALTVGEGAITTGTLLFEPTTARTMNVAANVTIRPGSTLSSALTGAQSGHVLNVGLNLVNDGTLDFSTNGSNCGATLRFNGSSSCALVGIGATTDLRALVVQLTGAGRTLDVHPSALSVRGSAASDIAGFLTLTSGTLKLSGTFPLTNRLFTSAGYTINSASGLWLANPNVTVAPQAASAVVSGLLRVSAGTYNVGTGADHSLEFLAGGASLFEGGTTSISGRFCPQTPGLTFSFQMLGGSILVGTGPGQTSTQLASFDMGTSSLSAMIMNGSGTITLVHPATAASGPRDYRGQAGGPGLSNGTVQFGTNASSAQTFFAGGGIASLQLPAAPGTQTLKLTGLTEVTNNVGIATGAILDLNGQELIVGGSTMTLNGTLAGASAGSELRFESGPGTKPPSMSRPSRAVAPTRALVPTGATLTGTGTVTSPLQKLTLDCPDGFALGSGLTAPVVVETVQLLVGIVNPAGVLTVGDGGAQEAVIAIGASQPLPGTTGADATQSLVDIDGRFTSAPAFNIGAGGLAVSYGLTGPSRSTSFEIPPSRTIRDLSLGAGNQLNLAGGNLSVTNSLTLTNPGAVLFSSPDSMLILTSTNNTIGYSPSSYVDGPLTRQINTTPGATRVFPVGHAGATHELILNGIDTGGILKTFLAELIPPTTATTLLPLHRIDQTRAWRLSPSSNLPTGTRVGLVFTADDAVVDPAVARVAQAPNANGPYHTLGGTAIGTPASGIVTATADATLGQDLFTVGSEAPLIQMIHPNGPTSYMIGQPTTLHWKTVDNVLVTGVDLFVSHTGAGGPFVAIATNVRDSTFGWVVTGPATSNARFRADLHDAEAATASDINDVDVPLINAAVDVEPEMPCELQLSRPAPNPSAGAVSVQFVLPRAARARLSVLDVQGRDVAVLADEAMSAGRHALTWESGPRAHAAGLYFIRLEAEGRRIVRRLVIAR